MAPYIEKKVLSTNGVHELAGRVYLPEGEAKGYFQVVHGMTEHIARYDRFMQEMAANGYICFGYDHLGHGHTVNGPEEWGFIAHKEGWRLLCRDVGVFAKTVKATYPLPAGAPYILMGHSMGSFIVRVAVAEFGVRPHKLIVMGTGGPNPIAGVGLCVMRMIKAVKGERHVSDLVQKLAFGAYNDRFKEENDGRAWLTTDREVRRVYGEDPMCTFRFSVSAMMDLVTLNQRANTKAWVKAMPADLPILLTSGREDPVGDYGKSVRQTVQVFKQHNMDVACRVYPLCRHEILKELNKQEIFEDITQWLTKTVMN